MGTVHSALHFGAERGFVGIHCDRHSQSAITRRQCPSRGAICGEIFQNELGHRIKGIFTQNRVSLDEDSKFRCDFIEWTQSSRRSESFPRDRYRILWQRDLCFTRSELCEGPWPWCPESVCLPLIAGK